MLPLDQLPADLRELDKASREEFSRWAACILIDVTPPEGLIAMVAEGKATFMDRVGHGFHGHDFKHEDIERIWRNICAYVERTFPNGQVTSVVHG